MTERESLTPVIRQYGWTVIRVEQLVHHKPPVPDPHLVLDERAGRVALVDSPRPARGVATSSPI
jgi:hypothetical protein